MSKIQIQDLNLPEMIYTVVFIKFRCCSTDSISETTNHSDLVVQIICTHSTSESCTIQHWKTKEIYEEHVETRVDADKDDLDLLNISNFFSSNRLYHDNGGRIHLQSINS